MIVCSESGVLDIIIDCFAITFYIIAFITLFRTKKGSKKEKHNLQELFRDFISFALKLPQPIKAINIINEALEEENNEEKNKGETKMKKFWKTIWYNKEQILSILFNALMLGVMDYVIFTDTITKVFPTLTGTPLMVVNIVLAVVSLLGVILSIRNTIVKYGWSNLEEINAELEKRVAEKEAKLTPEQKKELKTKIETLKEVKEKFEGDLERLDNKFASVQKLFNADANLVPDYNSKKIAYDGEKAKLEGEIAKLDSKMAEYKAELTK